MHADSLTPPREAVEPRQAVEWYRTLFKQARDGIVLVDCETGQIQDCNPEFEQQSGRRLDELKKLKIWEVRPPEHEEAARQVFLEIVQKGAEESEEHVLEKPDGERVPIEFLSRKIDLQGRQYIESITRDITERKRAREDREQLIAELEAKNAELERFTYTVSHDLKSPLVTIRGFLGLLQQDAASGDTERMHRDIEQISAATETMNCLLAELLELSRVGRIANPSEDISLTELAREAAEMVAGHITARGVSVEIDPAMPTVFGDRVRLLEVFQNLVENAVRFMDTQPEPRLEIGARQEGEAVLCFVRDNGLGIEPRYHEKVFGLFERLDVSAEGTGIGLALVKRIVEVHGGRAWVESEGAGRGATFYFTLPRRGG